jgi:hypothetical protein
MLVTPMDIIIILFLSYLSGCLSMIAYFEYLTLESPMTNTQIITIPLTSDLDLSVLLEIAQSIAEELEDLIEDAGSDCEIDEQDICVENK